MYEPPHDAAGLPDRPQRLAILGGGLAGLTAAFELTNDPHWRDRFESITVYQMGWRLGGKCASSRGRCDRIEEHGLHVWMGFYENAFRLLRECYAELGRATREAFSRFAAEVRAGDFPSHEHTYGTKPEVLAALRAIDAGTGA